MTDPVRPSAAALASLLLGVVSLVLPIIAGVPALLVGYRALYAINAADGRRAGRRLAIGGMVLGGLTTVLAIGGFVLLVFVHLTQKSRLVDCRNNLRRLGLAVNVYHDASPEKTYPLAALPSADLPRSKRLSWHACVLPYLDQENPLGKRWQLVYEKIDRQRSWDDPANLAARDTVIPPFLCPNDPNYQPPVRPAPTTYVGSAGVGAGALAQPESADNAGFFRFEQPIRRRDVTAGISQTLMTLETTLDNGPWIAAGLPTVRVVPLDTDRLIGTGAPFGGCHAGGMNTLFVDGSVRFESETIDPKLLRDLARLHRDR